MYTYRKLSPEVQKQWEKQRRITKVPWHAPAHFGGEYKAYLITGACYEHQLIMESPDRMSEWQGKLIELLTKDSSSELLAWVVLPNHYHVLLKTDLATFGRRLGRLHNGISTQWNREDKKRGRKVWYRYADRAIRSERHFYATINYIHANPVKHGWIEDAKLWPWSSLSSYATRHGLSQLRNWWRDYPVDRMGDGWDDNPVV